MSMQLRQGDWWKRAKEPGSNVLHQVVEVGAGQISTWSTPSDGEHGGWSFHGSIAQFLAEFIFCKPGRAQ